MFLIQLVRFAVRSVLPMVLVMWALLELLAFLLAVLGGILSVMAAFHYLGRPAGCAWIAALVLGSCFGTASDDGAFWRGCDQNAVTFAGRLGLRAALFFSFLFSSFIFYISF